MGQSDNEKQSGTLGYETGWGFHVKLENGGKLKVHAYERMRLDLQDPGDTGKTVLFKVAGAEQEIKEKYPLGNVKNGTLEFNADQ